MIFKFYVVLTAFVISKSLFGAFLPTKSNTDNSSNPGNILKEFEQSFIDKIGGSCSANTGFTLVEIGTGKVISSFNSEVPMIPASVMKVPSMIMALKTLGSDYRFVTKLAIRGNIKGGVLKGELYLVGEGDPFLTSAELFSMIQMLKSYGIKKVEKKFIYDETHLIKTMFIDDQGLKDESYNTGISALSVDFNRLFLARNKGGAYDYYKIPDIPSIDINLTNESFLPGVRFLEELGQDNVIWKMSKKQKYSRLEKLPMKYPGKNSADIFKMLATIYGIELPDPESGKIPSGTTKLYTNRSKPLSELVELTLEYSNNMMAELIFLKTVKAIRNKPLNLIDSGVELVKFYKSKLRNSATYWANILVVNGSGLSSKNRVTPLFLTDVLRYASREKLGQRKFWSLLSISGNKGTLFRRLKEPDFAYRVWAKTGSIDYVSGLAGYIISKSNKHYAFSILVNDQKKRMLIDQGGFTENSQALRREAPAWRRTVMKCQDSLIKDWIKNY